MDFSDEQYVRVYPGISDSGRVHGFWGRVLLEQLIKAADRAGVVELSASLMEDLPLAVASAIACTDVDFVREHLPKLMDGPDPSVVVRDRYLVMPRYVEAQYCPMTNRAIKEKHRDKAVAMERAVALGLLDTEGGLLSA